MLARYMRERADRPVRYAAPGVAQWLQLQALLHQLMASRTVDAETRLGTPHLPHLDIQGTGDPLEGQLLRGTALGDDSAAGMYGDYLEDQGLTARNNDLAYLVRRLAQAERRGSRIPESALAVPPLVGGQQRYTATGPGGISAQDAVQHLLRLLGGGPGRGLPHQARRNITDRLEAGDQSAAGGSFPGLMAALSALTDMDSLRETGAVPDRTLRAGGMLDATGAARAHVRRVMGSAPGVTFSPSLGSLMT